MAATTKGMGPVFSGEKKTMLPAGGARAGNVVSKSGLPTKPAGKNHSFGTGK